MYSSTYQVLTHSLAPDFNPAHFYHYPTDRVECHYDAVWLSSFFVSINILLLFIFFFSINCLYVCMCVWVYTSVLMSVFKCILFAISGQKGISQHFTHYLKGCSEFMVLDFSKHFFLIIYPVVKLHHKIVVQIKVKRITCTWGGVNYSYVSMQLIVVSHWG